MSENTKKRKSKLGLWLLIILIISGAAGGAGWWFLQSGKEESKKKSVKVAAAPAPAPIFLPLDPFTVNLISEDSKNRVIYIEITLRLKDDSTRQHIVQLMPEVRSRLLLLISRQNISELATEAGKLNLMSDVKKVLGPSMVVGESEQAITDVLFTTFILR